MSKLPAVCSYYSTRSTTNASPTSDNQFFLLFSLRIVRYPFERVSPFQASIKAWGFSFIFDLFYSRHLAIYDYSTSEYYTSTVPTYYLLFHPGTEYSPPANTYNYHGGLHSRSGWLDLTVDYWEKQSSF